jgi:hypothetical protein
MKVSDNKLRPLIRKPPEKRKAAMCEQSKVDDVLTKWSSCNGWTLALIRFDIDGLVCGLPTEPRLSMEQL